MQRRFLFIHQNFPGQFLHVAAELARQGHQVVALGMTRRSATGIRYLRYRVSTPAAVTSVELARDFEMKVLRGAACGQAMVALRNEGFRPDLIIGHPGWGELLFCKDVWPDVPLVMFAEFFYGLQGADYAFDPEFSRDTLVGRARLRMKNTVHLHALHAADAGYAPTRWQHAQIPAEYRDRFRVIFDGIDTAVVAPDPGAYVEMPSVGLRLTRDDEVITFVNRNLEPYRGFHVFMRALPAILQQRPQAHVLIVGGSDVSYGSPPAGGGSWRDAMLKEVGHALPKDRVHFLGNLAYADYRRVLQVSSCHVYLTYPFVLSWSCLEAMSTECVVVASRTPPVEEVISHGINGVLFDFFDVAGLSRQVVQVLANKPLHRSLGAQARQTVLERYDLRRICLPQQMALLLEMANAGVGIQDPAPGAMPPGR